MSYQPLYINRSDHKCWHCVRHEFYDMEMWSAHLDSQVFGLLVWHQSRMYYNIQCLIFQNTLSHHKFTAFPSKNVAKVAQLSGGMGQFLVMRWMLNVSQNQYRAVEHRARALTSCIACYCTATTFQFRCSLVPKSSTGYRVKGYRDNMENPIF